MRVLVVEDDIRLANIVARGLTEAGYAVDNAYDGEEAEYMAENTPYNIIVLDLMLPRKDGLQVCRDLRTKKINTPILMLTAKDTIDDRISGLDSGADDYLVKPFAFSELAARIRALSRREAEQKTQTLKFKDLEMDLLSREIRRGTRKIELTAKEYAMLEYFLRHPHVVLTRTMLEENIWNYSFDATSNIVDVYVRRLRLLLDDGSGENLIETVRGAGYRLG
jgi:two-component system, OmpR family, copper resistance phosphate regulon response regulator CusR